MGTVRLEVFPRYFPVFPSISQNFPPGREMQVFPGELPTLAVDIHVGLYHIFHYISSIIIPLSVMFRPYKPLQTLVLERT